METRGTLLEIRFSTIEQFAPYRERILSVFRNLGEREGMLFFVALNEAVNNALIHGVEARGVRDGLWSFPSGMKVPGSVPPSETAAAVFPTT